MILNLSHYEAVVLRTLLEGSATGPALDNVRHKLEAALQPQPHQPLPGQTTIDDFLEVAS